MPFNSFDDYPMSWRPGRAELYAPIYQSLADLLERDIRSGALPAGTKLPPQRELADFLDLNPSTVTKAYKLCEVRGLVHAVVGRGDLHLPQRQRAYLHCGKERGPGNRDGHHPPLLCPQPAAPGCGHGGACAPRVRGAV